MSLHVGSCGDISIDVNIQMMNDGGLQDVVSAKMSYVQNDKISESLRVYVCFCFPARPVHLPAEGERHDS